MRKLKWPPERQAQVLEYAKTHTNAETLAHFKISSSQLHVWKTGKTYYKSKKANGAQPPSAAGGEPNKAALIWLERWHKGYLANIRRGGNPTPYDLDAEHARRALRGEE